MGNQSRHRYCQCLGDFDGESDQTQKLSVFRILMGNQSRHRYCQCLGDFDGESDQAQRLSVF